MIPPTPGGRHPFSPQQINEKAPKSGLFFTEGSCFDSKWVVVGVMRPALAATDKCLGFSTRFYQETEKIWRFILEYGIPTA
jgi:hypothetical protein